MTQKPTPAHRQRALLALVRNNGNVAATARALNLPRAAITRWRDEANRLTLDDLERVLLVHAAVLAGDLLEGAVVDAPLNQRASALGMVVDRLLKLEARRAAPTVDDAPAAAAGPPQLVFRDRAGNLRAWGDWESWEGDDAPDADNA